MPWCPLSTCAGLNCAVTTAGGPWAGLSPMPVMAHCERLFGPGCNAFGFGPNRGMGWQLDPGGPDHTPLDGLKNAVLNTTAMHVELLGWACGSLVLFTLLVLRGRWSRSERAHLALVALVFVAYFLNYFGGGPDFGARYWHTMIVSLCALTACELRRLGRVAAPDDPSRPLFGPERVLTFAGVAALATAVAFMPWRCLDKYHDYRGMHPGIEDLAGPQGFGDAVVLVAGNEVPDFAGAILANPLDVTRDAPVFAWDRSVDVRRALVAAYPDRLFWLVDGPTRSGGDYAVRGGPYSGAEVLSLPHWSR